MRLFEVSTPLVFIRSGVSPASHPNALFLDPQPPLPIPQQASPGLTRRVGIERKLVRTYVGEGQSGQGLLAEVRHREERLRQAFVDPSAQYGLVSLLVLGLGRRQVAHMALEMYGFRQLSLSLIHI